MNTHTDLFKKITAETKLHQQKKSYKKFKKIDTHEHVGKQPEFDSFQQVMDEFNIEKVFLMPTGSDSEKRQEKSLQIQNTYPDNFLSFSYLNSVGTQAENHLNRSIKKGAKGLKLLLWHPNIYPKKKIELDSQPVAKIFSICSHHNIPVNAHISLRNFPEHKKNLENMLTNFPHLTFIAPHYIGAAPRLDITAELLNKFPNLYTDVSMGGGKNRYVSYVQGFRKTFRRFFKDYHQRLFWGTDIFIKKRTAKRMRFYKERIKHDINLFDERFFYSPFYEENRFLHGLNLPDKILEKVFYNNAKKVFKKIF